MRGVAPQIPGAREGHAAARRYEGRGASLISPSGWSWLPTRRGKWGPCGNSAPGSCQEREEICPGFHIVYKTVTSGPTALKDN